MCVQVHTVPPEQCVGSRHEHVFVGPVEQTRCCLVGTEGPLRTSVKVTTRLVTGENDTPTGRVTQSTKGTPCRPVSLSVPVREIPRKVVKGVCGQRPYKHRGPSCPTITLPVLREEGHKTG